MNERIKKLAETAGFYFYDMHDVDGQDLGESIEADEWSAADKFAELIVRECAQLARDTNLEDVEGSDSAVLRAAKRQILEHFGVEE